MTRLPAILAAFAAGIACCLAFVLACGDAGSGPDAASAQEDASTKCDCPAVHQPFADRLRRWGKDFIFPDGAERFEATADCAEKFGRGSLVISGGCMTVDRIATERNARVSGSDSAWSCAWEKAIDIGPGDAPVAIDLLCLVPEGTPPVDAGP